MSFSNRFIISQVLLAAMALALFVTYKNVASNSHLPKLGFVQDFSLTNQDNIPTQLKDLKNKVWVADFVFTTCSGICPSMSKNMSAMSKVFNHYPDVRMVSFSVNPENDTPEVLKKYASKYDANDRWVFLTGSRDTITKLAVESFKMGDMKEIVFHSAMFVLVDRKGRIRGYYDSGDASRIERLHQDIPLLRRELDLPLLPTINATLNALSGLILFFGFLAIKRRDQALHRKLMMAAIGSSGLFLACYLYYHATSHIITYYQGQGIWRTIYFLVLGTHTPLAALIVPFIFLAVKHAIKGDLEKHTKITKWLYPTWMYVSITGVVVYLMLYVFRPA